MHPAGWAVVALALLAPAMAPARTDEPAVPSLAQARILL